MYDAQEAQGGGVDLGMPAWVMTFADLMSLLMCFFVLLLSFSEMDVLKFKRLAGSMSQAFGVQQKFKANDPPKGTSIIAQEFSPGKPEPTPLNQIWQKTTDLSKNSLEVACQDMGSSNIGESGDAQKLVVVDKIRDLVGETEENAIELATALSKEIAAGVIEVETEGRRIIVRVKEHVPSNRARLRCRLISSQCCASSRTCSRKMMAISSWKAIVTTGPYQRRSFALTGRYPAPAR